MRRESHEGVKGGSGSRVFTVVILGIGLVSLLAGFWAGPGDGAEYLDLQEQSDPVHRLAVMILPGSVLALLVALLMKRLGWRLPARALAVLALPLFLGMLAWVIRFDRAIERAGLSGQLIPAGESGRPGPAGPWRGPFREEPRGGLTTPAVFGQDHLILDRRTLSRRGPDGTFRWNRPRPGRPPAALWVDGGTILYAGPGADYPDDVVTAAVDLSSGILRWNFHCLGRRIRLAPQAGRLALAASRPSLSLVALLELGGPARRWSVPIPGRIDLPPRFTPRGIQVAAGSRVWLLDSHTGKTLGRIEACTPPGHPDVVCEGHRVVAWKAGGEGDQR